MTDRDKIIEHINKIEQYSRQPGNEWLLEILSRRFGSIEKIDEVYEYCIEKNARDQAQQFYKNFPIQEIIPVLIEDFVKMEFYHRKNSFNEFSFALYQQIENITNKVCSNRKLNESVSKLLGHPAYIKSIQQIDGSWKAASISDRNTTSSYQIARLLWGKEAFEKSKSNLSAQWAVDKIYCVLYFLCYKAQLKSQDYHQFNEYKDLYNAIYQFRNLNHRGAFPNDYQRKIINEIKPQQGVYYFKFMQALLFFVEGVANGLADLDVLFKYAQSQKKITVNPLMVVGKMDLPEK